jgi:uncharacterized phage infection (PIP) family protein YhgE
MEKRHESTKDFVQRTKDMLEARVDQITQYNSRLEAMQESIAKVKDVTNLFQENITGQMNQANEKVQRLEGVLHEFMDEQKAFFTRTEFWNDEKTKSLVDISKQLHTFRQATEDQFSEVEFALG